MAVKSIYSIYIFIFNQLHHCNFTSKPWHRTCIGIRARDTFSGRNKVKIEQYLPGQNINQLKTNEQKNSQGGKFADALAKAQGTTETASSEEASSVTALGSTSAIGRILAAQAAGTNPVEKADQALNTLENYAQALGDPSKSLKEISSLVKDMEREAQELDELGSQASNPTLGKILNDTSTLMSVEVEKFNRGDYS